MSEKAKRSGRRTTATKRKPNCRIMGDELEELNIWSRHEHDGFTTLPRTLTYINRILDFLGDLALHYLKPTLLFGAEFLMRDLSKFGIKKLLRMSQDLAVRELLLHGLGG